MKSNNGTAGIGGQIMTNGDKIRQMTDKELFIFLKNITDCCFSYGCIFCKIWNDKNGICDIEQWLKQEAEQ